MDHEKGYKVVYTIVERRKDQKPFWLRIGVAFMNRDGSWNVHLDAVPTNGKLHIRDPKRDEDRAAGFGGFAGRTSSSDLGAFADGPAANGNGHGHGNGNGHRGPEDVPEDVFSS